MSELYIQEVINLINNKSKEEIYKEVLEYHPYEVSEALLEMSLEERTKFYKVFKGHDISEIISYLDIDDTVDIMLALDAEDRTGYLKLMDIEHRESISSMFKYKEDSAGSIMTTEYIEINIDDSVEQAMKRLLKQAVDAESINTLYVTDSKNTLVGTLSLREMILARKGQFIKDIMNSRIISVLTSMDQEDVADIVKDYDFTSVPVVDTIGRMLGIITIDDIVDVIEEEASEDYSRLAAIADVDIDSEHETIWMSAKKRLPWLLILSVLGFLTSTIIVQFEGTLAAVPTIALFMPMILGMAGNTGTQSLAVTVRGLNSDEFTTKTDIRRHLIREVGTGLLNGFIIGAILFVITYGFLLLNGTSEALQITQVVSLSIVASLTVSTFSGALIPIIINSFKIDPAVASGPFVTMIVDILALSVYFGLATILIINTL